MTYKYEARSESSQPGHGLGYHLAEDAHQHATKMNDLLMEFDTNPIWNKEFWKSKPGPWAVYTVK